MPRYFFDVGDRDDDTTGVELDNAAEAAERARRLLGSLVAETPVGIGEYKSLSCTVRDAKSAPILRILLAQLVENPQTPRGETTQYQPA